MKFWITKWALTRGIEEADLEPTEDGKYVHGDMGEGKRKFRVFFTVKHAHETRNAAVLMYRDMVRKRIASLKKTVAAMTKVEIALDREIDVDAIVAKRAKETKP